MSNRRNRPPNRWGCKPTEDVCVKHDLPLENRRGCVKQNAAPPQDIPEGRRSPPAGALESGSPFEAARESNLGSAVPSRVVCEAKAHAVQGQDEPVYLCAYCGDVTNEPRCPHDMPKQSYSGLDY